MSEVEMAEMIDKQRVAELTTKFAEPEWVATKRLEAWEAYLQTPMPTSRDEAWRRTDLSILDLTKLRANDLARAQQVEKLPALPSWFESATTHFGETAGVLFQTTKNGGYLQLKKELADRGVIFCDVATAIEKHADKIRPYIAEPAETEKFSILTTALFNCGAFLYVPPNVEVTEPFLFGLGFSSQASGPEAGGAIFPRVFVVAGENSKANFVFLMGNESVNQAAAQQTSLASVLNCVHVKANATVNYLEVQDFGDDVFYISTVHSNVARDANFNSLSVGVGGRQTKSDIATYLEERGANSNVLGAVLGNGKEHFNFNTIQEHNAPDTKSNINFRVAVKDKASSVYQGIIKVDKTAQRTDAFQSNKNLILGGEAKADSVPKLEILANDVKCSHGATVGPVDQEQLFYLNSRGLTSTEAEELIVLGFFNQVLEQFPLQHAIAWLTDVVSRKVHRSIETTAPSK